ncbi:atlastin GTPase [Dermatophagoides pteronyssinus]|uniref:Atlastin-3-like n=2 Tax=Dermatophagoides pteronyssinus TaxID=6956 RepID=A0A6P6YEL0_DERPT|nr:atlastin-3-like [Dermatophagoides pteronyssinus]KAH9418939.1 putative RING-H2 finger protein [Dermatophagoides pteronyssinus]
MADHDNEVIINDNGSSTSSSNGDYELITNPMEQLTIGQPVQIVKVTDNRKFELDVDALESILLRESIRDKPVAVVSIAGDFRKGKSFMLNHFLGYLQATSTNNNSNNHNNNQNDVSSSPSSTSDGWLSDPKAPLKGFSWRGGCQRDTTGILMWSEPFIVRTEDNKEVAVILMDTQGAFDSEYTIKDSATVFALSTMTSSIQVFNIMHNLQEDNLQVLEIFLEYGRLALESVHEKPFQKLVFLIRDWSYPYEHPYGFDGGHRLLEKKLELKDTMPEQLQRVRRKIRECFKEIGCFLMPHPGSNVATAQNFDGRLDDYHPDFANHLRQFVPSLLSQNKIIPKEIGGRPITGRQLLEYFKVYINVFAGDTMPEPKTMLEATAEANNLNAVAVVKDIYTNEMESICGGNQPYINPTTLEQRHADLLFKCMEEFDAIPKMGGAEYSVSYRERLEEELIQAFEHFAIQNKSKNVFGLFGTPLILLVACFICFMTARIIEVFGVQKIANIFVSIGTMDLAIFIVYVFGRYSGNYPSLVTIIDQFSEQLWLFLLDNLQSFIQSHTASTITQATGLNVTSSAAGNMTRNFSTNQTNITNTTSPISGRSGAGSSSHQLQSELHKRKTRKD